MPVQVMLDVMRRHYRSRRFDEAARVAALAAPYVHARLASSTIEVKRSLAEEIVAMSDEELRAHIDELEELAGLSDEERALIRVRVKGHA
jgi:hypothetical protein